RAGHHKLDHRHGDRDRARLCCISRGSNSVPHRLNALPDRVNMPPERLTTTDFSIEQNGLAVGTQRLSLNLANFPIAACWIFIALSWSGLVLAEVARFSGAGTILLAILLLA